MVAIASNYECSAISLHRYAELIGYEDCAFYGVSHPDNARYACREIWSKRERDQVAFALIEAQEEIEHIIGYPLCKKYFADKYNYSCVVVADRGKVIESGVQVEDLLEAGAAVDHAADPATVTVPTGTLTSTDGLHLFYVDTDVEIEYSKVTIVGANFVFEIPRCRIVAYENLENPDGGWVYSDTTNFEDEVDVKRIYTDDSQHATVIWSHLCSGSCPTAVCTPYTATACQYIEDNDRGIFRLNMATHNGLIWTPSTTVCRPNQPSKVILRYAAGMQPLTRQAEMTIIRLAHSKMPQQPCNCDWLAAMWRSDNHIPQFLTRERLECPFGLSNGAWMAWKFADSMLQVRASVL